MGDPGELLEQKSLGNLMDFTVYQSAGKAGRVLVLRTKYTLNQQE